MISGLVEMGISGGLVRSRLVVSRVRSVGSRWSSTLPLCSAVIVTVLGVGITLSGLATYLGRS